MKRLTLNEQIYLLAIFRLKEGAYGVQIRNMIVKMTSSNVMFGTIYNTLDSLAQKGFVQTIRKEPPVTKKGNKRVYYSITPSGLKALKEARELQESIWKGISDSALVSYEE
ncbi:PadR family transcriptional regulator [Acidobacteriota bacterium]